MSLNPAHLVKTFIPFIICSSLIALTGCNLPTALIKEDTSKIVGEPEPEPSPGGTECRAVSEKLSSIRHEVMSCESHDDCTYAYGGAARVRDSGLTTVDLSQGTYPFSRWETVNGKAYFDRYSEIFDHSRQADKACNPGGAPWLVTGNCNAITIKRSFPTCDQKVCRPGPIRRFLTNQAWKNENLSIAFSRNGAVIREGGKQYAISGPVELDENGKFVVDISEYFYHGAVSGNHEHEVCPMDGSLNDCIPSQPKFLVVGHIRGEVLELDLPTANSAYAPVSRFFYLNLSTDTPACTDLGQGPLALL